MEDGEDILKQVMEWAMLYDFYGALLKEQKRKIFEDYILNDYSLGELAGLYRMSRQGIFDTVKRCKRELENYEEKLGLLSRFQMIKEKVRHIQDAAEYLEEKEDTGVVGEIKKTAGEILENL